MLHVIDGIPKYAQTYSIQLTELVYKHSFQALILPQLSIGIQEQSYDHDSYIPPTNRTYTLKTVHMYLISH